MAARGEVGTNVPSSALRAEAHAWRSRSRTDRSCRNVAEAFAVDRKKHATRFRPRVGIWTAPGEPATCAGGRHVATAHAIFARRAVAELTIELATTGSPRRPSPHDCSATIAPPRLRSRARPSIQCPLAVRSGRHAGVTACRSHARAGSRRPTQTCRRRRTGISSATPRALVGADSAPSAALMPPARKEPTRELRIPR